MLACVQAPQCVLGAAGTRRKGQERAASAENRRSGAAAVDYAEEQQRGEKTALAASGQRFDRWGVGFVCCFIATEDSSVMRRSSEFLAQTGLRRRNRLGKPRSGS